MRGTVVVRVVLCAAALSLSSAQFAAAMPLGTHDDDGDGRTLARSEARVDHLEPPGLVAQARPEP